MKRILITILGAALLAAQFSLGQPAITPVPAATLQKLENQAQNLAQFDLDFPGGTPRQLVEAIEKASGKPLNAIIPDEDADLHLPPLKMRAVNVEELFKALSIASQKTHFIAGGFVNSAFGFKALGNPSDNSVWYFYHSKPTVKEEMKACRFYQLAPYLETYQVEDITTAIQTGWKMLGETNLPTISYHKDTKLLIAVGEPSKLQLIDSVLQQLAQGKPPSQREAIGAKTTEPAKK